jgi:hypothetical protein
MCINARTPTNIPFEFNIDTINQQIVITTQNRNNHAYMLRSLLDLYLWLKDDMQGEWVLLGTKQEAEEPNPNTVEAWARSQLNPVNGFYGLTNGRRCQFASYVPSILECLGFLEVTHNPKNNTVRVRPIQPN